MQVRGLAVAGGLLDEDFVVSEIWQLSMNLGSQPVRGLFWAKAPNSSFAEVHGELPTEPTHMEDEDEDQEIFSFFSLLFILS